MKAILLDYTSVELSELDEQMEAHPFQTSEAFERKMKRALCWRTGRLRKSLVVIRNVLAYAAAFFLILMIVNEDARANVFKFTREEYAEYVIYGVNGVVAENSSWYRHEATYIPGGYETVIANYFYGSELYIYDCKSQSVGVSILRSTEGRTINVDNSDMEWREIQLPDGTTGSLGTDTEVSDRYILLWYKNGAIYCAYGDSISLSELMRFANGIRETDEEVTFEDTLKRISE